MGKVLITGAAGGVGSMIRPLFLQRYKEVIVSDVQPVTDLAAGETFHQVDLADPKPTRALLKGVDRVLHLGGKSIEGTWEEVLQANILGSHNLYESCRSEGVNRVVFASSNHVTGFYGRNRRLSPDCRLRPDSRYALSKAFGEGLAALYADKYGIGSLSIRIGNIAAHPADTRGLSLWLHPEDFMQLCSIGFEHPDIHNQIVWGASDNARTWWDNETAFRLGYRPRHKAEDHATQAARGDGQPDPVADRFQGGVFCAAEFAGDLERTYTS